ncbi:MAG: amino acid adenylation domain-containing protein [Chloroflexota bacterium]|nr:amino acid adenylation domain-containing protein [Chloroflexota bacterium]
MSEQEQQQLMAWNATQQEYSRAACVPQLVERQANVSPGATALVANGQILTYGELNTQANQLAHYLQQLGVRPDTLVGICVERSLDMLVGLLGVLKAGGAYVPMDPSYPPERLSFMVEDAQVPILLTQQHLTERFASDKVCIICLDSDKATLLQQSVVDPTPTSTITNLAYVIYTSGSTGQPKGVQITHESLLNLVSWHQRAFSVTPADRATQVASPAFDATGWELWPYLTAGASVYLPDEDIRAVPIALRDWLLSQGITITFLPTPLAESIMVLEWPATTSLRYLLTGADTLHHYPSSALPFALINNYGPTEATVVTTSGRVPPTPPAEMAPTIGRPIDNMQVYILDEQLNQVPIGMPGELYIGGDGLARGYLNRPELTAERFIHHPFSNNPAARLYKTGDVARWLPDGQIAFMGRNDQQIKIRGYRIEPGEIVSVINRHPSINTSVVIAREETLGDKHLVGYIVPAAGSQVTEKSLHDILATCLPDYMIPSIFVQLEALPLTSNGKVDRVALPVPDTTNIIRDSDIMAPSTPLEKWLADIMTTLLGLDQIGLDENFFMLGGHSLLGTQIITRVSNEVGVDLPLRALFEAPTIRRLSAEIDRRVRLKLDAMSEDEVQQLLQ